MPQGKQYIQLFPSPTRISDWPGDLYHGDEQYFPPSSRGPPWWSKHPGMMTRNGVTHLETPSLRIMRIAEG